MKTLIYTTAVDMLGRDIKDTDILDTTKHSWIYYCNKYGYDFEVLGRKEFLEIQRQYKLSPQITPHWLRYFIFDYFPDYDQYIYVDCDTMVSWKAPELDLKMGINSVIDTGGLSWIWEGINAYQTMFEGLQLDWTKYFNTGVIGFDKELRYVIEAFRDFVVNNWQVIYEYRERYRKGFDQTVFNYFIRFNEIIVNDLGSKWNMMHMIRSEAVVNEYFTEMGYVWHFNGFPRDKQVKYIQSIWTKFKDNYQ